MRKLTEVNSRTPAAESQIPPAEDNEIDRAKKARFWVSKETIMKARQWKRKKTLKKLTAVSLGVMLAVTSLAAQATLYDSIERKGSEEVEGDTDPIVIVDDDVIFDTTGYSENIAEDTAPISISANRSLVLRTDGEANLSLNTYYEIDFPDDVLTADLESKGTILITNGGGASDGSMYLTNVYLDINKNKTATQVTLIGNQSVGSKLNENVYFTGKDSSFTGQARVFAFQDMGPAVLSFYFEPDEGATATMNGVLRSIRNSTVNLTAESGTIITGIITSEYILRGDYGTAQSGNVNINLHGNAVLQRGDYTVPGRFISDLPSIQSGTVGYSQGTIGIYTVNSDPGTTILGDFEGYAGAEMDLNVGGTWVGDAIAEEGFYQSNDVDNRTHLNISVTGNWSGDASAAAGNPNIHELYTEPIAASAVDITVTGTGTWTGSTSLEQLTEHSVTDSYGEEYTLQDGIIDVTVDGDSAAWNLTKDSTVTDLSLQSGSIRFPAAVTGETFTGTTLTVVGDYTGSDTGTGGTIAMNTVLAGDASATDKLIVKGNTSGNTLVTFTNVGGSGAQTVDGIEVIEVDGTSDGVFTKPARNYLKAGAYVYQLTKADGQNWFLTSQKVPEQVVVPETDDDPSADDTPAVIPATDDITNHIMRPEIGSYANNLYAANTLFTMSLYERLGETMYSDALRTSDKNKSGNFWLRALGGHTRNRMEDGDLTTRGNWGVVQVGGDLVNWPASGSHRFHLGLMAGYAHESSRTTSPVAGYSSKGKVSGYSVGLYGTWMNQKPEGTGPYADTWLMWSRFKNTVSSGNYTDTDTYHSKGFTWSIEGGYTFPLKDWMSSDGTDNAVRLQLQGQVIRMGVRDGAWTDTIGSTVQGIGAGNVRTRVGLKLYHQFTNDRKDRAWKPFIGLNWYHDTKAFGAKIAGVADHIDGGRNFGEVKLGVEGKVKKNWNVWGFAGYQQGSEGFRNLEALAGLKYLF